MKFTIIFILIIVIAPLVSYSQNNQWVIFNTTNSGLTDNNVTAIAQDKENNMWIGTSSGGLCRLSGGTWTNYNTSNSSLVSNSITALKVDTKGNLWIGMQNAGVCEYDGSNWTVFNKDNSGLPGN